MLRVPHSREVSKDYSFILGAVLLPWWYRRGGPLAESRLRLRPSVRLCVRLSVRVSVREIVSKVIWPAHAPAQGFPEMSRPKREHL